MSDPLQIHHEQQKSTSELREQFRADHQRELRDKLRPLVIKYWDIDSKSWKEKTINGLMSDYVKLPDLTPQQRDSQVLFMNKLSQCTSDGEIEAIIRDSQLLIPQSFGLESVPSNLTERLYDKADETETFEAMSLPAGEGTDHDGPVLLQPIEMYTDIELINYVDSAIAASKEKP